MLEPRETDDLPPPPRRFPWKWALLAGLGVAVLAGLIAYVHSRGSAEQELASLVENLDRTEPGWRFGEIQERRAALPDEENGALQVIAFKKALPRGWLIGQETLLQDPPTGPRQPYSAEHREVMRKKLAEATAALVEARKLAGYSTGRFPIKHNSDVYSTLLPDSQDCRTAVKLLGFDIQARLAQGDMEGALVNVRASLGAAQAHGDEPISVCQLIRMSLRMEAVRQLERVLSHGVAGEGSLARLRVDLEVEDRVRLLELMARGERGAQFAALEAVERGDERAQKVVEQIIDGDRHHHSWNEETRYWFMMGGVKRDQVAVLQHLTRFVEIARQPSDKQEAPLRQLMAERESLPLLARLMCGYALDHIGRTEQRSQAELRCAIAALAVERYRLTHDRWPEKLADLRPRFLAELPGDPYTGQPLLFRPTAEGVVIYAVGPDGADDGGTPLESARGAALQPGDIRFQLFDVAQRGRLDSRE